MKHVKCVSRIPTHAESDNQIPVSIKIDLILALIAALKPIFVAKDPNAVAV